MLGLCLLLLIVGLLCLLAEVFMPGFGVAGVAGLVLLAVSALLTALFVPFGWFIVAVEGAVLLLFGGCAFHYLRTKQWHGRLVLEENLAEDTGAAVANLDALVGQEGVAVSPLRPCGEVDFNGIRLEAASEGAFIPKGTKVAVIRAEKGKLTVRAKKLQ